MGFEQVQLPPSLETGNSTNSSDNIYTMINPVPPGGSRSNFPMGPGSDGPMGGMGGMEPHHMNGSLVFSKHDDECVTLLFSEMLREPALQAGRCQKLCKKK
ncbi:Single-stranded DNA-binding protein 3 [Myotis brandtii]|uniref:Single-stranded DNA-binding protein 3 n=1 Tax=Myotis brandtii TaxID=109478 RepID=S7NE29_MYOBR|nr:Single-stranded DNA-binding protein 3 [Myotis brandtii]